MQRVTMTLDEELLAEIDAFMARSGASNRSEALRDLARRGLGAVVADTARGDCVGVVSYVCRRATRDLGRRIADARHDRHDRTIAATTVPLDHDAALEVEILRGDAAELRAHAEALFLERGVLHGSAALCPVRITESTHAHGEGEPHAHVHLKVRESF
ncbi:MAG: nickel-responsive transcriptional regulator NikR [Rubrimonas sp.]|uniref:nickel-responsive transcriptional regulator NikR n=1 Tax=Rubrimonas sp. TaxID=2036015 RepID=UPI002FDEF182